MKIGTIKQLFWIPKKECYYLKSKGTTNEDKNLTKIILSEHLELDNYEPKQIFYILDSNPKLVLEFDKDTYKEMIEKVSTNK